MLKVISSEKKTITVDKLKENWLINGEKRDFDIKQTGQNHFHIIAKNQSISAEFLGLDELTNAYTLKINGKTATFQAKTAMDELLEKMGIKHAGAGKVKEIKAPMPGQVIEIFCNEGDEVKKGDKALILEAMKMENMIKSPGDGKIKSIKVEKGENVEKDHLMIIFE